MKGQKLLAGLLSVIMILGTMAMPAFAADVAISDGADFKSALISNNTITLNDDITCNGSDWGIMNNISDLTINGNGHTITFSGAIDNGGNGEGMIQRSSGLNVSNLTIEFPNDDTSSSAFNYVSNSTFDNVTIKNGRFGILNEQGVKIKNCNFINQSEISIYSDDDGNTSGTEIKNCTFTDSRAYIARSNEVITGNVVTLVDTSDINALTVAPSAEATISGNLLPEGAKLELFESDSTIESNVFLGGFDTSVSEDKLNNVKNNNLTTAKVFAYDADDKFVGGYATLENAINEAPAGTKLKLMADGSISSNIDLNNSIDLNGNTLNILTGALIGIKKAADPATENYIVISNGTIKADEAQLINDAFFYLDAVPSTGKTKCLEFNDVDVICNNFDYGDNGWGCFVQMNRNAKFKATNGTTFTVTDSAKLTALVDSETAHRVRNLTT